MAVDSELNDRFRAALDGLEGVSEKRMMGGTCFFLHGNMLGGADRAKTGERRFMFRVGKENQEAALHRPGTSPIAFGGRRMGGMVFVDAAQCDAAAMREWVALAAGFVGSLPAKA